MGGDPKSLPRAGFITADNIMLEVEAGNQDASCSLKYKAGSYRLPHKGPLTPDFFLPGSPSCPSWRTR